MGWATCWHCLMSYCDLASTHEVLHHAQQSLLSLQNRSCSDSMRILNCKCSSGSTVALGSRTMLVVSWLLKAVVTCQFKSGKGLLTTLCSSAAACAGWQPPWRLQGQ